MKKKRLNRDGWGFQYFPYYQMRIDCDRFHGMVCLIKIVEGETQYWEMPNAGRVAVCGQGMTWLQLIPDEMKRVVTVKYFQDGNVDSSRVNYPSWAREELCPSLWYVDVIENIEYDEEGIVVYVDKYLDVIFSPEGDIKVDDRDELDAAYESGELSKAQYEEALAEGDAILKELCEDISATAKWCAEIRKMAEQKIEEGHKPIKRSIKMANTSCDSCANYVYDEDYECYCCMVNLDEDEMYRFLSGSQWECPYYSADDEYAVVRHQM